MKKLISGFSKTAKISISIAVMGIMLCFGVKIALAAWVPPTGLTPPAGNIAAPINISSADQYKMGGLRLGSGLEFGGYKLYVDANGINDKVFFRNDLEIEGNIIPFSDPVVTPQSLGDATHYWDKLYLRGDTDSGLYFEESGDLTFKYNSADDEFGFADASGNPFVTINSGIENTGLKGNFLTMGDITANGALTVDTNTLVVNEAQDRVSIGATSAPYEKFQIASGGNMKLERGNILLANGRLTVAVNSGITPGITIGTYDTPLTTAPGLESYSEDFSAVYGRTFASSVGIAGVSGYAESTDGVYGVSDSSERYGVYGYNTSASAAPSQALYPAGVAGQGANFGAGPYVSPGKVSVGVLGIGGDTATTAGIVKTSAVYGKAGTASRASASDSVETYGVYGKAGSTANGGLSYAGYFEGNVKVTGQLEIVNVLHITGDVTVNGNLHVTGDTTVDGLSTLANANVGSVGTPGALNVYGDTTITGDANITTDANISGDANVTGHSTASLFLGQGADQSAGSNNGIQNVEARKVLDSSILPGGSLQFPQVDNAIGTLTLSATQTEINTYGPSTWRDMWWSYNGSSGQAKTAASLENIFPVSITATYTTDQYGYDWTPIPEEKIIYNHCDSGGEAGRRDRLEISNLPATVYGITVTILFRTYPNGTWTCDGIPTFPNVD